MGDAYLISIHLEICGRAADHAFTLAHQQGGKVLGDDDSAAGAVVKSLEGFFFYTLNLKKKV